MEKPTAAKISNLELETTLQTFINAPELLILHGCAEFAQQGHRHPPSPNLMLQRSSSGAKSPTRFHKVD